MELLLTENSACRAALSVNEVDALLTHIPDLNVVPARGSPGQYVVTAAQFVGHVHLRGIDVEVRPKIPMRALMFMLAYTTDSKHWHDLHARFTSEASLLDAIAAAFGRELSRTCSRGLLRGYVERQDGLPVVRGRVLVKEQLRRWFGQAPPVECQYDEFTDDILENRLLKAALRILRGLRIRNPQARAQLARAEAQLDDVSDVSFDARALPEVAYTRLNDRFRRAIELARLILRSATIETGGAGVIASAFLVDVAGVFESFVLTALRESPALQPWVIPRSKELTSLDVAARLGLVPDLTFRHQGGLVAVGDVKYKKTRPVGNNHPDAYQVLAYSIATNLPHAFLVYPRFEQADDVVTHVVRHVRKSLHALALDVNAAPEQVLKNVNALASVIRAQVRSNAVA